MASNVCLKSPKDGTVFNGTEECFASTVSEMSGSFCIYYISHLIGDVKQAVAMGVCFPLGSKTAYCLLALNSSGLQVPSDLGLSVLFTAG